MPPAERFTGYKETEFNFAIKPHHITTCGLYFPRERLLMDDFLELARWRRRHGVAHGERA
jgi:hypothetical protein